MNTFGLCARYWGSETPRHDDERDEYHRDKSRIIHSAAFRRLQAKTQVMGVGEGDFHRTRLTHSIETAQIGEGLLLALKTRYANQSEIVSTLPTQDLVSAACYAHDLGHPPFGHGGERALHKQMVKKGCSGFEGNGQTLRILTRLEKYHHDQGINPTRRLILATLKYPASLSELFDNDKHNSKPPKCYLDTELEVVKWALKPFNLNESQKFQNDRNEKNLPRHQTLDCSIVEAADDIAYAVHDLEDIVGRGMVTQQGISEELEPFFSEQGKKFGDGDKSVYSEEFATELFGATPRRKAFIGKLVNLFVTSARIDEESGFADPLLKYRVRLPDDVSALQRKLKDLTFKLVVEQAQVQQLEKRGERIVSDLFEELCDNPDHLIPKSTWESLNQQDSKPRRVCDYIAGMTDSYAQRIYQRLFIPGVGSSRDEL